MDRSDLPDAELPPAFLNEGPSYSGTRMSAIEADHDDIVDGDSGAFEYDSRRTKHDQLPTADEYKAGGTVSSRLAQGNRLVRVYLASLLTIILLIILIAIVATLGSRRSKANAENFINNHTMAVDDGPRASRLAQVLHFIGHEQEWSDPATLLDGDRSSSTGDESFQYLAARWLADLDPRHVSMDNTEEFRTRYVLALFYYAMHGDRWEHEVNWLTMHSYCAWNNDYPSASARGPIRIGVECDPARGNYTVTKLFLPSLDLQGQLPTELGWLVDLETLDLYTNDISGSIPEQLQSLQNLTTLVLHNNHLGGALPTWIGSWTRLETLDLARNKYTGPLPSALSRLPNLKNLNLENNQITGTLEILADRDSLRYLALGENKLTGSLTTAMISSWYKMTDLDLSDNHIVGPLPANLFLAPSLETIDLHGNNFTGTLPLANVTADNTRLKFLALFENELSGPVDGQLAKLRSLEHLDLSRNRLNGSIPALTIATMVQLKYLFLAFNPFEAGPIHPLWASLYQLRDLSLQRTNRNGKIPSALSILDDLTLIDFSNNNLTGSIPRELGNLTSLKFLILKNNRLSGRLPSTLGELTNLDTLVIDNNDFDGGSGYICFTVKPVTFVSDCMEVGCSCCSKCCDDHAAQCYDDVWFAQQDPSSNYQYARVTYKFNEQDVVYPLPDEADAITAFYDTFGLAIDDELFSRFANKNVTDP